MPSKFIDDDFLLHSRPAQQLYHEFAASMPIIDYHCHLPPDEIANNRQFNNLTEIWLNGDHYKWRALRTNGINEKYITGDASDYEKFEQWAKTVPYTMRNPLYHWSHLELQRYFGISNILNGETAKLTYDTCTDLLNTEAYRAQALIRKMNVEVVCTTDDPIDTLEHHQNLANQDLGFIVLPAFRPDKAIFIDTDNFNAYIERLGQTMDVEIRSLHDLLGVLKARADFFHERGCRLSDHGLEQMYSADFTDAEADKILQKKLAGKPIFAGEAVVFKSAMLYHLGKIYHSKGWTQQFHLGALRNNNSRMMRQVGPDTGFDSIGDFSQAHALSRFLDRLDNEDRLAKTILYNLHPADNEVMATMIGNFNDGSVAGKIQFGSGWWFLDQLDGMEKQMNTLSNMGLISRFVGMLTDSRSFLSYPRHEYFRRLICNMFGDDVEKGLLPNDLPWIGKLIQDICYNNAKSYFNFSKP